MMPERSDSVQPHSPPAETNTSDLSRTPPKSGKVYLVGAGPGDPRLITWRGTQCLQMADAILYDGLANPQLLQFGADAELISVGKHGKSHIWTQQEINAQIVSLAKQGKIVVRLKGGDPAVFARTAEELEVLCDNDIPFEVVPGITAALAAASYVGIPITHRDHASAVAFITGQQQKGGIPQHIDWTALARFPGTLVFYMGVTTVATWTRNLLEAGKAASTSAAIVRRCSWSDQAVIRCQLADVAEHLTPASKLRPPVIVIVGDVAALGENFDWFSKRPLHGCGILVTRPIHQSTELTNMLQELGADVFHQPCITIQPPSDHKSLDGCIAALTSHSQPGSRGITFSSRNGVQAFMRHLFASGLDIRSLAGIDIAAVGPATANCLQAYGLTADLVPEQDYSTRGLLSTIQAESKAQEWFVTTTNESRGGLADGLESQGKRVHRILAYETAPVTELLPDIRYALEAGRIQLCTVTSAAIGRAAHKLLGNFANQLKPIALSGAISSSMEQLQWPSASVAQQNSDQSLADSIVDFWLSQ